MQLIKISLLLFFFDIGLANARGEYGLYPVDEGSPSEFEIASMPRTRSQDSLGLCYSFAAATLLDAQTCIDKLNGKNCENMDDKYKVSPLDLSRYGNKVSGSDSYDPYSYNGIHESKVLDVTLRNALHAGGMIASETCSPYHQIVAKNEDPKKREELEINLWKRLKHLHEKAKKNPNCDDCQIETATAIEDIRKDFQLKASNQDILNAFAEDSFALFLDKALIEERCRYEDLAEMSSNYEVKTFPTADLPNTSKQKEESYSKMLDQIKNVLKVKKVPLGLNFCAEKGKLSRKSMKDCAGDSGETSSTAGYGHSVVISGYRRVCKTANANECYDAVRVQNSWGQDWQDKNNDGWVDARELLKRTFFEQASLTWLEKKE